MPLQQTAFENIVEKGEIAQSKQFLHLPQCFPLFALIIPSFIEIFGFLPESFQSRLLHVYCMWYRVKAKLLKISFIESMIIG